MEYGHPESHLHNHNSGNTASPKSDPWANLIRGVHVLQMIIRQQMNIYFYLINSQMHKEFEILTLGFKTLYRGLPWWLSGWESAC